MAKLTTIAPKEPNAILVRGGYFPLPLNIVGPNTWHNIMGADYGTNPINGTNLVRPTFAQVAELAGFALKERYTHRNDRKYNPAFNPVIDSINGSGKVLTGNTIMVIVPEMKLYVVNNPSQELSAQFGVNDQNALEELVAGFNNQIKGIKEESGIARTGNISAVSVKNVSQGDQSKNSKDDNYLGKNLGLVALAGSRKVAEDLAVGSKAYALNPYFSLNSEGNQIATRVPVFYSLGFDYRLDVDGNKDAGHFYKCSFGVSECAEGARAK